MPAATLFDLPADLPLSIGDPPPCATCGAALVRTSARWYTCPAGHGGLTQAPDMRPATAAREERKAVATFGRAFLRFVEVEKAAARGEKAQGCNAAEDDHIDRCPHCSGIL